MIQNSRSASKLDYDARIPDYSVILSYYILLNIQNRSLLNIHVLAYELETHWDVSMLELAMFILYYSLIDAVNIYMHVQTSMSLYINTFITLVSNSQISPFPQDICIYTRRFSRKFLIVQNRSSNDRIIIETSIQHSSLNQQLKLILYWLLTKLEKSPKYWCFFLIPHVKQSINNI